LTVTRLDTAEELRTAVRKSRNAAQTRRLLATAPVLDGNSRAQSAEQAGMDRQTLRDWVHRYNEKGIDGLRVRPKTL